MKVGLLFRIRRSRNSSSALTVSPMKMATMTEMNRKCGVFCDAP